MATDHILALLLAERDKLNAAIEVLQEKTPGPDRKTVQPSVEQDSTPKKAPAPQRRAKRTLSAEGRMAIIAATKKRWAAINAAKAAAETPAAAPAKAAPAPVKQKSAVKNAAFRKKMSETMKKAWAARKKATAKRKTA